jgi:hypothetical protein
MIFLTTAVTVLHRITGTQKTLVLRTGSLSIRFCTYTYYDSVTVLGGTFTSVLLLTFQQKVLLHAKCIESGRLNPLHLAYSILQN